MYCSSCGVELNEDAKFCSSCGKAVSNNTAAEKSENLIKCPKCLSTQVTANPKGFSAGKAIGGAVLTGGVGLLAGFHGSKDVMITCLACGNQFKAGEGIVDVSPKSKLEGIDIVLFDLLKEKQHVLAVKSCMEAKKCSISEANDYLRKLALDNGLAYNVGDSKGGCAGALVVLIIVGSAIACLI